MHDRVRLPVARAERRAELDGGQVLAAVRVHEHEIPRLHGERLDRRPDAEFLEDAQGVRGELEPRADLGEFGGLLDDVHREA